MPITKSAAKHVRQSLKRNKRNLVVKTRMKKDIRALINALAAGNSTKVAEALKSAQSSIDKAAKNHLVHHNKAARQKSRLSKLANQKAIAKPAVKTSQKATAKKTKVLIKKKTTSKTTKS